MTLKRILFATPRAYPDMGGIETHVYEVSRRIAARGIHITVLTADRMGDRAPEEVVDGVQIIRVPAYPKSSDLYIAPKLGQTIAYEEWDILHVQGYHTFVPPLAMWEARRAKLPYVLTYHSGGNTSGLRNWIRPLQVKAQRGLYKSAHKLIGVSQFEADQFRDWLGLPANLFTVVPNGSTLPSLPDDVPPKDPNSRLILSVGRLEQYKGHHRLIRAMPAVLAKCPQARLRILGLGPYEATLKQLVQNMHLEQAVEVTHLPPSNRGGMAREMHAARLVALMSEYEAHPISVIEAASLGCSLLVADTSGLGEVARKGIARAIPLDSTDEQIATAILQQLEHPHTPTQFALQTWDDCTDQLLNLYTQVLAR